MNKELSLETSPASSKSVFFIWFRFIVIVVSSVVLVMFTGLEAYFKVRALIEDRPTTLSAKQFKAAYNEVLTNPDMVILYYYDTGNPFIHISSEGEEVLIDDFGIDIRTDLTQVDAELWGVLPQFRKVMKEYEEQALKKLNPNNDFYSLKNFAGFFSNELLLSSDGPLPVSGLLVKAFLKNTMLPDNLFDEELEAHQTWVEERGPLTTEAFFGQIKSK